MPSLLRVPFTQALQYKHETFPTVNMPHAVAVELVGSLLFKTHLSCSTDSQKATYLNTDVCTKPTSTHMFTQFAHFHTLNPSGQLIQLWEKKARSPALTPVSEAFEQINFLWF